MKANDWMTIENSFKDFEETCFYKWLQENNEGIVLTHGQRKIVHDLMQMGPASGKSFLILLLAEYEKYKKTLGPNA